MFDISFSELLVVALLTVLFIRPDDLPAVLQACGRAMRWLRGIVQEVRGGVDQVMEESGAKEAGEALHAGMRYIEGDDGKMYPAYDLGALNDIPLLTPNTGEAEYQKAYSNEEGLSGDSPLPRALRQQPRSVGKEASAEQANKTSGDSPLPRALRQQPCSVGKEASAEQANKTPGDSPLPSSTKDEHRSAMTPQQPGRSNQENMVEQTNAEPVS